MQFNVAQLLKEGIGSTRSAEIKGVVDLDVAGDGKGGAVHGNVEFTRTNRGIMADGAFDTEVKVDCSRCLNEYKCPLHIEIQDEYFPLTDINTGTPLPVPEEPDAFTIDEQHVLDLTESIRQGILLAMPMKPLCREDCAGLCPQCGQNLNEKTCNCASEKIDPRWSKLVAVKSRLNEEEGK